MKLFYIPMSMFSQKALLAFYEKGVPFERERVNLADPAGRAAFEQVYPIGKVPLLMLDDGYLIPESTIIIEYLEGHFAQGTQLIPDGVDAARRVRFHDRMADLYVTEPTSVLLSMRMKFREYLPVDVARAHKTLGVSFAALNRILGERKWVAGEDFSMADCALMPNLFYLSHLMPFEAFPNLVRYWAQAQQRSSFKAVQEEFLPVWEEMLAAAKG